MRGSVIKKQVLKQGKNTVILDMIYPLEPISNKLIESVTYYIDDEISDTHYANKLIIQTKEAITIDIKMGLGYKTTINEFYSESFNYKEPWGGSDGIYSFNLTNGNDAFDQKEKGHTLFVFGDTFVGKVDPKTYRRYEPLLMPNNTYGYLDPKTKAVNILINQGEKQNVESFFKLDDKYNITGTIPQNLVEYNRVKENDGYLSGLYQKEVILDFDLHKPRHLDEVGIINYFSHESETLSDRGVKELELLISNDNETFELVKTIDLKKSKSKNDEQRFKIGKKARYIRFNVKQSHNKHEPITGLSSVKFYQDNILLRDVEVTSNTVFYETNAQAWLWLQDGVVIDDKLYFFPMTIISDTDQPEGLQFAIKGVVMLEIPIKDGKIIHQEAKQKLAPFLFEHENYLYLFGGAIMANTKQAGALNPDGYIYVYGYRQHLGYRETILARVKAENMTTFDDYEFYDGKGFTKDILKSAPLFAHVSCEFSVSEIREGRNKGKYISVFTYDTDTIYLAYSIGETPWGPFSKPQKFYRTPEVDYYKSTTYTYNAKAHPHLSESKSILVSYNTNTYNFDHNMSNATIYHPRFVNLIDTDET